MAILKKRQSKASLPEATTDKGVIVSRPSEGLPGSTSATPKVAKKTKGESPAAKLTSVVKSGPNTPPAAGTTGTQTSTGAKPIVSAPVGTAAPSMTTKLTGTARPTVAKTQGQTSSSKALTGALTGALAGAGAKYVYDKATGKLKPTTPTTTTKPSTTPPKIPGGSTSGPKVPTIPTTGPKVPGLPTNKPTVPKAPTTGGKTPPKVPTAPKAPGSGPKVAPTPNIGGAVTEIPNTAQEGEEGFGWKYYSDGTVIDPDGNYYRNGEMIWSPQTYEIENTAQEGDEAFGWQYFSDGTAIDPDGNYYKDGQMIWSPNEGDVTYEIENTAGEGEEGYGWQYFSDGTAIDPDGNYYQNGELIWSANEDGSFTEAGNEGTFTWVDDEGYTMVYDAEGNIISYDNPAYASGDTAGTVDYGDGVTGNADGTYTYVDDEGYTMIFDANGIISYDNPSYNSDTGSMDDGSDEGYYTGADGNQYYIDDNGNYYDGDGNLIWSPEGSDNEWTQDAIDNYVYTDEYGNQYDFYGNLTYENTDYFDPDYVYTDDLGFQYDWNGNIIYDPYADDPTWWDDTTDDSNLYTDEEYSEFDDWWGKRGGFVTMMKDGGVPKFAGGGEAEYFDDGSYIMYYDDGSSVTYDSDGNIYDVSGGDDSQAMNRLDEYQMAMDSGASGELIQEYEGWQYFTDGTAISPEGDYYFNGELVYRADPFGGYDEEVTEIENPAGEGEEGYGWRYFSDGTVIAPNGDYYRDGVKVYSGEEQEQVTSEIPNTAQEGEEGYGWRYFSDGTVIGPDGKYYKDGELIYDPGNIGGITSPGGAKDIYKNTTKTPAQIAKEKLEQAQRTQQQTSVLDTIKEAIGGSGYLGAGAAGAVLGALLGNTDLFSGGTGQQNQGIDMSKVGVIPARTTDFGIGAPRYVTYSEYGARDQMPDLYGDELYKNLNAPGFNPVNEGDYGYEETPAQTPAQPAQGMADGGLAGGYYTFGKAVDPLSNITNPRPAQQPSQPIGGLGINRPQAPMNPPMMQAGTPEQMKPQQTQMPPAMKSGGLPAISNVPLAAGRLDFRQGSAVHGPGDGQSDDIPAMLADGEYVIDAETVAQIGNGSTKAGAKALDEFRKNIRKHKRGAPLDKIPPKTKALTSYLKKGK